MASDSFGRRIVERKSKNIKLHFSDVRVCTRRQLSDDPPYYAIGTEVSARFRGAFCEARIKAVQLAVTCKLSCDDGIIELDVRLIRGFIKAGSQVEFVDPGTQQTRTGVIVSIKDCSLYTVDFDGGDERMLRRSQLCLKGGKHFLQAEALNSVPLASPEQFSSPVKLTVSRSVRRNRRHQRPSASSHAKRGPASASNGDRPSEKTCDKEVVNCSPSTPNAFPRRVWQVGDVVTVAESSEHQDNNQNNESTYYPGLVVVSDAFSGSIPTGHYVICSFKTGRVDVVHEDKLGEFTGCDARAAASTSSCKPAVKRALTFLETSEVPSGWNRAKLLAVQPSDEVTEGSSKQLGPSIQEESSSEEESESSDSESEEDMELKNLFVAHLYKFMDERGTPINKCPSLGGRDLDLHALYRKVQDLGGYTRVSHKNLWKMLLDQLRSKLGPSVTVKSLKGAYIKYLSNFDLFIRKIGYNFSAFGSESSRTSARSKAALQKELRRNNRLASDKAAASKSRQRHATAKTESAPLEERSSSAQAVKEENEVSVAADVVVKATASSTSSEISLREREEQSGSFKPGELTVGQLVLVQYGSKSRKDAYKARVLQIHPKRRCLVHYAGWSSRYDEVVPFSRVLGIVEDEDVSRADVDVSSTRKVESSDETKVTESRRARRRSSSPELTRGGSLPSDSSSRKSSLVAKAEPSLRKRSNSSLEKASSSGEYPITKSTAIKRSTPTAESVGRKSSRKFAKLSTSMENESSSFHLSDDLAIPHESQRNITSNEEVDAIGQVKADSTSSESVEAASSPLIKQFAKIESPSNSSLPRADAEEACLMSRQEAQSPSLNHIEVETTTSVELKRVVDILPPEVHVDVEEAFCRKEEEEYAVFVSYCAAVCTDSVAITVKACPPSVVPSCSYYQSVEMEGVRQDGSHFEAKEKVIVLDNDSGVFEPQCAGPSYFDWSDYETSLRTEVYVNSSSEIQEPLQSSDDMDLATVNLQILEREVMAEMESSDFLSDSDSEYSPSAFDGSSDTNTQIVWLEQAMRRTKKEYCDLRRTIVKLERRRRWSLGKKTPSTEQNSSDTAAESSFDE
ncbi:hypothetical protein M513_06808 [Trichuris suis]|uniref:ARID domain-containing protein n=1 Tax=Trichuris suis TaxID=68888 RepID=A0A085M4U9_9BILA|nr:hypothetical protein M513_06808 [Trichuris suis]